ncbi:MAG TPA: hypothetical protein VF936_01270 [Burkholderiales bacterium]
MKIIYQVMQARKIGIQLTYASSVITGHIASLHDANDPLHVKSWWTPTYAGLPPSLGKIQRAAVRHGVPLIPSFIDFLKKPPQRSKFVFDRGIRHQSGQSGIIFDVLHQAALNHIRTSMKAIHAVVDGEAEMASPAANDLVKKRAKTDFEFGKFAEVLNSRRIPLALRLKYFIELPIGHFIAQNQTNYRPDPEFSGSVKAGQ